MSNLYDYNEPNVEVTDYNNLDDLIKVTVITGIQISASVPSGGKTGQVLAKLSDKDFDADWVSQAIESGLGSGSAQLSDYIDNDELVIPGGNATGKRALALGEGTVAQNDNETVLGKYNSPNYHETEHSQDIVNGTIKPIHQLGIGTKEQPENAYTTYSDGSTYWGKPNYFRDYTEVYEFRSKDDAYFEKNAEFYGDVIVDKQISVSGKLKLNSSPTADDEAVNLGTLKSYLSTVYSYQGTAPNYEFLESLINNPYFELKVGYVYNVLAGGTLPNGIMYPAGSNFAWTGSEWDLLGGDSSQFVLNTELESLLANKVDKLQPNTYAPKVYLMMENGAPGSKYLRIPADGDSIAQRTGTGALYVGTPTLDGHATTKKYVDDRFNGANKSLAYANYQDMINDLSMPGQHSLAYRVGQNIYIQTLNVPDLWISEFRDGGPGNYYTYTSDEDFINELKTNGFVKVGYYNLSALETQKVDLSNYATVKSVANKLDIETFNNEKAVLDGRLSFVENNKLDAIRTTTNNRWEVYITKGTLGDGSMYYDSKASGSSLVQRDEAGRVRTKTPKTDDDSVNLAYFNANVPKLELTLKENGAYTLSITTPAEEV